MYICVDVFKKLTRLCKHYTLAFLQIAERFFCEICVKIFVLRLIIINII